MITAKAVCEFCGKRAATVSLTLRHCSGADFHRDTCAACASDPPVSQSVAVSRYPLGGRDARGH